MQVMHTARAFAGRASEGFAHWRSERAEKKEARRVDREQKALDAAANGYVMPPGYPAAAHWISWIATAAVLYFLWLYCVDEAKDVAMAMEISRAGLWTGDVKFYFPVLLGFVAISAAVALCCKYWISFYVMLSYKRPGEGWPKAWTLVLGILTSTVVVLGSFSVMQGGRIEGHRDEVVIEQRATSARAALQGELEAVNTDLRDAMGPEDLARPSTQMQACRNTEETWRVRIRETAPDDPQRGAIARAISDAVRCDQLRADRRRLMSEIAALPVDAEVQGRVVAERDRDIAAYVDGARNLRSVILSLTADMLAILFAWIALRLDQVRQQQLKAAAEHKLAAKAHIPPPEPDKIPDEPNKSSPDELDLPILADWRLVEDPEFTQRHMMVDEHGRRQKRVAGHWRVDDDRAPRGSSRDRRRSDSQPTADNPEEPGAQSTPEGDDIDDLMSKLTGARVPEEQTQ